MLKFIKNRVREFLDIYFDQGKEKRSTYQRIIPLPPGQRYKFDLVVKDVNSKDVGTASFSINVPRYGGSDLQSSTIILANSINPAPTNATTLEQYIIGDLRIVPNVKKEYISGRVQNLAPYMQIYGIEIDQATRNPSLDVEFVIKKGSEILEVIPGSAENSEQLYYGDRVVLIGRIPVGKLAPGNYQLEIRVLDKISNKRLATTEDFIVKEPPPNPLFAAIEGDGD